MDGTRGDRPLRFGVRGRDGEAVGRGSVMRPIGPIRSIQYLHGFAAVAVVACHTNWLNPLYGQQGVDVFFVISGFIMMLVSKRETRPLAFLRARALRVVPLYWVCTLAWALLFGFGPVSHLIESLLFWPHLAPNGLAWPVIPQGWTLTYEAFFYAVFAMSLLAPHKWRLAILSAALAALVAFGLIMQPQSPAAATFTNSVMLEFLTGAGLQVVWRRKWLPKVIGSVSMVIAGLAAFVLFRHVEPGALRCLVWGLPSLAIVAGCLGIERAGWLPQSRPLLVLGDASFALYLTHRFAIEEIKPVFATLPTPLAIAGVVVVSTGIAWAVHRLLEKPLGQWLAAPRVARLAPIPHGTSL